MLLRVHTDVKPLFVVAEFSAGNAHGNAIERSSTKLTGDRHRPFSI